MSVKVLQGSEGFAVLEEEWNDLLRRSITNVVFLTYEYQKVWWDHLGEGDLFFVAVRDDTDRLVGIAPFFRTEDSLGQQVIEFVGCFDVSDYLDVIADREHVEMVCRAVMEVLTDGEISWDVLSLCNIPEASSTRTILAGLAHEQGYNAVLEVEDVCPVVDLPATWEEYLATLEGKDRREIRRKLRKAGRTARVEFQLLRGEEVLAHLDTFFELHQKSHPEKAAFMTAQMKGFFRAMSQVLGARDWVELALLRFDGVPVATMLSFDYNNEIQLYNSGFEATGYYAALSPGWVLTAYYVQNAIERGKRRFDFLRGDEDYKYRFGGKDVPVYRLTVEK